MLGDESGESDLLLGVVWEKWRSRAGCDLLGKPERLPLESKSEVWSLDIGAAKW